MHDPAQRAQRLVDAGVDGVEDLIHAYVTGAGDHGGQGDGVSDPPQSLHELWVRRRCSRPAVANARSDVDVDYVVVFVVDVERRRDTRVVGFNHATILVRGAAYRGASGVDDEDDGFHVVDSRGCCCFLETTS